MQNSNSEFKKYLDPKVISGLQSLDLKARMIVEGFLLGLHRSPYHGFSIEFSQHRQYMPGDALKDVDWKVFGKTDRYYVKQYEEETNLKCNILLDCSNSMAYASNNNISKLEYAKLLAAALTYLLIGQKDAVGLGVYSDKIEKIYPPKASNSYMRELIAAIASTEPANKTDISRSANSIAEKIKKRGLVVIISDFFDDIDNIIKTIKHFRFNKNEVVVFQVLDPMERNFSFKDDTLFTDLESGVKISTQPYQIQKAYKEALAQFCGKIKLECDNNGIDYNLIDTSTTFDKALYAFLQKRAKLN